MVSTVIYKYTSGRARDPVATSIPLQRVETTFCIAAAWKEPMRDASEKIR